MRLFSVLLFLTLVGSPALSAPHETVDHPVFSGQEHPPAPDSPDLTKEGSIQILGPSITPEKSTISLIHIGWKPRAMRRLQIHVGSISGELQERAIKESSFFVGALGLWKTREDQAWDTSLDFTVTSWLRWSGGRRYYVGENRGHRPYLRWGLAQTTELNHLPTGVFDLQTLKGSVGVGFGNLFNRNEDWTAQFDLQWGAIGPALQMTLGWNFDF